MFTKISSCQRTKKSPVLWPNLMPALTSPSNAQSPSCFLASSRKVTTWASYACTALQEAKPFTLKRLWFVQSASQSHNSKMTVRATWEGGMFEVLNENLIRVTTDHFSGYIAARCRGPKTPTEARWSVYGCNDVKGDKQSAVITAYACADTRLKIADFRKVSSRHICMR